MADPLHNKDYRDFNTRVSSSTGTGLDENRGKTMAYQAPLRDPIRKGAMSADRELPSEEADLDRRLPEGGNHRLNRTAEQINDVVTGATAESRVLPDHVNGAGTVDLGGRQRTATQATRNSVRGDRRDRHWRGPR